eukprot:969097-Prymnesium_polylepis.1
MLQSVSISSSFRVQKLGLLLVDGATRRVRSLSGHSASNDGKSLLCELAPLNRGLDPRGICRLHRCHRRTTTCERREGERGGGGPTSLCKRVPGGRAHGWRSAAAAEAGGSCDVPQCAGRDPGFDRRLAACTVWARRHRRAGDARAAHRGLGSGCSLLLVG